MPTDSENIISDHSNIQINGTLLYHTIFCISVQKYQDAPPEAAEYGHEQHDES